MESLGDAARRLLAGLERAAGQKARDKVTGDLKRPVRIEEPGAEHMLDAPGSTASREDASGDHAANGARSGSEGVADGLLVTVGCAPTTTEICRICGEHQSDRPSAPGDGTVTTGFTVLSGNDRRNFWIGANDNHAGTLWRRS